MVSLPIVIGGQYAVCLPVLLGIPRAVGLMEPLNEPIIPFKAALRGPPYFPVKPKEK